jgi:hypothetical protein
LINNKTYQKTNLIGESVKTSAMIKKFSLSNFSTYIFRSAIVLSAIFLLQLSSKAQTVVNKRLYMKTGSALNRVVPTSATVQTTTALFKQTAVVTSSGSFATGNSGSTAGSLSSSPTTFTPAGSNRLILVAIGSVRTATNQVTGVTFGATALTKLSESVDASNRKIEYWYLINPSTTAAAVTVNWPSGQTLEFAVGVVLFRDIDIIDPFGPVASNTGSTSPSSLNVTSASGDIIVDAIARKDNSITAGTGQTQVFNAGTNSVDVSVSYKSASTGAVTQTSMSWDNISGSWATLGFAIKGNSNDVSFTQSPAFCSNFTLKAGSNITVSTSATVSTGTASGATLPMIVTLLNGTTEILELTTATNTGLGATGTNGSLVWTGQLASDVTITAGQSLSLRYSSDYQAATISLRFDATSAISYVELPTTTYININSLDVYNAAIPGGTLITNSSIGATNYIRAVVSDPFGFDDITGLDLSINGATAVAATSVATLGCTRTYEYAWTPSSTGPYTIAATAKEGTENTVTHTTNTNFTVNAPSVAVTKTVTSPSGFAAIGTNVTFNIAITNNGLVTLSTIPLKDEFNSSCFQFVSSTVNPVSYANGVIAWNNVLSAPLTAGATRNITVVMKVVGSCSPLTNTARVEGAKDAFNNVAPTVTSLVNANTSLAPVAVNDSYCVTINLTNLTVLANDTDGDVVGFLSSISSAYDITIVSQGAAGTATANNTTKVIEFNRGAMAENQTITFTYKLTEIASGFESTPATVTVTYSTANDAPVASNDVVSTPVDAPININVLSNDADADGAITTAPTVTVAPNSGTVVVNADNTITYIPYSGFSGTDVFTYSITGVGCPTPNTTSTATVTINVIPTIKVCRGSTSTISVPAIGDATSYTWTLPTGVVITSPYTGTYVTTTNSITVDWSGVAAGIYDICAKATNSCGTGPDQCTKVQVLEVNLTSTVTPVGCFGSKTGAIDITPSGGQLPYTYSWTGPNGYTASIEDISGLAAGNYTVTVTEANGCAKTSTITVSAPAEAINVTASITDENPFGAANGAIDVSVTGGTSPYTYSWSNGVTTQDLTGLSAGTYRVTVTDANGCTSIKYFTVNRIGGPLDVSALIKTDLLCAGGSTGTVDLEIIGGTTPYTYTWSNGATSQDLSGLPAGTYSVTITDAASNSVSTSVEITGPAAALSATATSVNPTCAGASTGSIDVTPQGGTAPYTYSWNTGATTQDLTNVPAGSYNVIITDANGCTTTVSRTLTAPAVLVLTGTSTNSTCGAANGTIDLTVSGGTPGYTYAWSNGATTQDLSDLAPGTYTVVVTDAAGCKQGKSFTISNSCLGLAKTISSSPVNNGDGTYTLTYSIKVQNVGTTLLSNVQVTDNLTNTFVGATGFTVNSVVCNDFAVNSSYNGTSNTNLLATPLGSLVPNQITNIQITVTVTPGAKLGVYDNSASGSSTDPNGTPVNDVSQDGTDVDPDSNGPGDNSVPTPVSFTENPKIGIAKAVTEGPTSNGNGSYDLTYTFVVTNAGDVPLKEVQVTDNLTTTYGAVPLSVLSITSPTLAVNSSYNGTSNLNMLAGTDVLAVRGTATIVLTIRVTPSGIGPFNNTAIATGKSPANTSVTDDSQDGALTDPDADGDATNNNVPTPVSFTENPSIGLAKALSAEPINNQDGTYTLTYDFILRNTGDVPVKNLQVFDTLSVTYPGKTVIVNGITTSANLTASNTYTGTGANTGLLSGTDTLAVGESGTISLTITVTPGTPLGVYNNSAKATGNGPLGTPVSDISNDGADADPENNGASDNSIPTPVSFTESPQIGIAKKVNTPTSNGDGTYNATYTLKVTNTGDVPLSNIQVTDNLATTFSGSASFEVMSVATSGTLTANNSYNGSSILNILVAASSALATGQTETITIVVKVRPGANLGVYNNNATVSATSPGGAGVNDISTDGSDVDPDENSDPGDNSIPTPLSFVEDPKIGVAKRVSVGPTSNGNGTYNLSYDIRVQNLGDVALSNVQVIEDLTLTYANAVSIAYISSSITTQPASSTLVLNGSFNGSTNTDLLNGTGTLQPGEFAIIRVNITVNPGLFNGPYENTATAYGTSPAGTTVVDDSQDGANVDTDSDGDANNNNTPTPVTFTLITISGKVFNDVDGLTDNLVDGDGTNAGGLFVSLVNPTTGAVIASIPVNSDGTYTFTPSDGVQVNTSYNVILTPTVQTVGATLTSASLPSGWTTTGEILGTGTGSDGTPNSILSVTTGTSNVTNVNFGIEHLPTAGSGEYTTLNPGGSVKVIVPPSTFTNTTPSSDIAPGTVTSIRITAFPSNATTITINGITYTSSTFPTGGVIVPTDTEGNPSWPISVDPTSDGETTVTIPFRAIDNAGKESENIGNAVINFTTVLITGTVFNDVDGLTNNTVDGIGTDAGGLYVNLVDPGTNQVIASVPVNNDGTYSFSAANGVLPNTNYKIILTATLQTAGQNLTASTLPSAWSSTGENLGSSAGNDGSVDGILSVNSGTTGVSQANFGIQSISISGTIFNDTDGLTDSKVDGTGTNAGGLYVNLVNALGQVVASIPVNPDGTYTFTGEDGVRANTSYSIILTSSVQTVGANLSAATLPSGWTSTGEYLGTGVGSDGTVNSILSVTTGTTNVINANLAIQPPPIAGGGYNTDTNPGGITQVTVPTNTFTNIQNSTDIAPGTVTQIRITAFPTGATSIVINGVSYTSGTFPAGGVFVPTDANGNPTQTITVDPDGDGSVRVIIPFKAIDNAGQESANTGTAILDFDAVAITGTVFNDTDALTDGNVDGTGTNAGGLYANLVNPETNEVIASVPVSTNGTYIFTTADGVEPLTTYNIILTATAQIPGNTLTTATLPAGWVNTGEDCCDNAGSDGTVNSILTVSTTETGISQANFGIQQPPFAGSGSYTTFNPGGTTTVPVPASTFNNITPSSDITPGTVTAIRITAFPSNATSITINGVTYTSGNFPAGGVTVPTDALGNPTQPISVDPAGNGNVTVTIPIRAIDNAGYESANTGTAVINFSPVVITGTVFNDQDALTDGNVDGIGTNAGGLYVNLVDPSTNQVIASIPVNTDGTYTFTVENGVLPNSNYNIILTATEQTAGQLLTTASLPAGWISTGEDCCDNIGSDGVINGKLTVSTGTTGVTNANFGIKITNTLPVIGLEVSGMLKDNVASILWSTLQEIETDYFEVERSLDNQTFTKVGRVAAAGTSASMRQYKFDDDLQGLSSATVFYYRIKQFDRDGKYTYSKVVVLRRSNIEVVKVMPNPFVSELNIRVNALRQARAEISIMDANGKVIYRQATLLMKGINNISVKGMEIFAQGAYFLRINTGVSVEIIPLIKTTGE